MPREETSVDKDRSEVEQELRDAGIDSARLPRHIAVIMDGNGRWARRRHLPRIAGHRGGIESVRDVVRTCSRIGIEYLTLYTFSMENWQRPRREVASLMKMLSELLRSEVPELHENNVRVLAAGRLDDLPVDVRRELDRSIELTSHNDGLTLILALSYSGRAEIIDAVRKILSKSRELPELTGELTEDTFRSYLYLPDVPDPDLLIRTSGELRVSNFLLWQIAYSEIVVTELLWPDFRGPNLLQTIADYQKRERRFGKVE